MTYLSNLHPEIRKAVISKYLSLLNLNRTISQAILWEMAKKVVRAERLIDTTIWKKINMREII